MRDISNHQRVNDILLGPLERPALKWFCSHMPAWVTPDILTGFGMFGALVIMIGYLLSHLHPAFLWLSSLGYFINWFGDSLDGSLARYRHIERPIYGFFVDHISDAICQVIVFIGLGLTPYINYRFASFALIAYLLLSVLVYLRTYLVGEFKISYSKLGPTELRALAVLLNTAMYFGGLRTYRIPLGALGTLAVSPYDIFVAAITLLMVIFFANTTYIQARQLAKLEK